MQTNRKKGKRRDNQKKKHIKFWQRITTKTKVKEKERKRKRKEREK